MGPIVTLKVKNVSNIPNDIGCMPAVQHYDLEYNGKTYLATSLTDTLCLNLKSWNDAALTIVEGIPDEIAKELINSQCSIVEFKKVDNKKFNRKQDDIYQISKVIVE